MKKKTLVLLVFFFLLIYPGYKAIQISSVFLAAESTEEIRILITHFQLSIWLSWVGMAVLAVYYKWTEINNLLFKLTYGFLVMAFGLFGYFTQHTLNIFNIDSRFSDSYTLGVFTALQHLALAVVLTIFLQIAVRIFQTKWHRH